MVAEYKSTALGNVRGFDAWVVAMSNRWLRQDPALRASKRLQAMEGVGVVAGQGLQGSVGGTKGCSGVLTFCLGMMLSFIAMHKGIHAFAGYRLSLLIPTAHHAVTAHLMGLHSAIKMLNSRVWIIQQLVQKMQSGV